MEKPDGKEPSGRSRDQTVFESVFERILWNSRYIVLLGVIFGVFSAIVLFFAGSLEIFDILREYLLVQESQLTHEHILITIIGAIDFYLIGLVLLIFQFRYLRTLHLPA